MTIRELYKQAERKGFLDVPIAVENKNGDYSVPHVDFHDREAWQWEEKGQLVEIFPKIVILEGSDTEVDYL